MMTFNVKFFALVLAFVAATILFTGCVSPQTKYWNAAVGHYTYDNAVMNLGAPNTVTKLNNNWTVAEWVTRYYSSGNTVIYGGGGWGGGYGYYPGGVSYVQTTPPQAYDTRLILTFNTNNILAAWSRR